MISATRHGHTRWAWRYGVLLFLFGVAALGKWSWHPRAATGADVPAKSGPPDPVAVLRGVGAVHYAAVATVQVWATEELAVRSGSDIVPGEPVQGYIEFWGSGPRYRWESWVDPGKMPWMVVQVAYDGESYQFLLPDGTLSVSSAGDRRDAVPALPDPLLELVQVHYPLTDENAHLWLRFKNIQGCPPRDVDLSGAAWERVDANDGALEVASFPGGVYEGRRYTFRVYVPAESRHCIQAIERISEDGDRLTRTEFDDYRLVAAADGQCALPHSVVVSAYDSLGVEALRVSYRITHMELDAQVPEGVFRITEGVQRVWDDDGGVFVRSVEPCGGR